jgi:DNA-binding NarL/FixJ family response regulator
MIGDCGWLGCIDVLACEDLAVRETVVVIDDHEEFRASARLLLEADGFNVVGEAATGADGCRAADRLRPYLVVLDIRLPDVDGFEVAERLASLNHPPNVVLVSSRDAVTYGPRLASAPVRGFVPKSELSGAALRRLID